MKPDGSLTDLEMWSFWRDKKGYEYALESQYSDLLKSDECLQTYLNHIEVAKHLINKRMAQLADEENTLNG